MQMIVVPAFIRDPANIPGRAIVGQDHPVFLKGAQDHLHFGRITREIKTGLEAKTLAHGGNLGFRVPRGVMPGRPDIFPPGDWRRKAEGMSDFPGGHFFETDQTRQDREAGGIGRGPGFRPQFIGIQIELGTGPGLPGSVGLRPGIVQLV